MIAYMVDAEGRIQTGEAELIDADCVKFFTSRFSWSFVFRPDWHPTLAEAVAEARSRIATKRYYTAQMLARLDANAAELDTLAALAADPAPLTNDRLKALAANNPPPQSWYDEDQEPPPAADPVKEREADERERANISRFLHTITGKQ